MMSDHARWTGQLSAYLDGELAPLELAELERHLAVCAACRAVLGDLRAIADAAPHYGGVEPERDLWPGVAAAIEAGREVSFPAAAGAADRMRSARRYSARQLVAASLATLLIGLGSAWVVFNGGATEAATGIPEAAPVETRLVGMSADEAYDQAVADLERVLAEGRTRLDSATVRVIEENLAVIDRAIAEAEAVIEADPGNVDLQSWVAANMRRKLDLLRRAASAVSQRATES